MHRDIENGLARDEEVERRIFRKVGTRILLVMLIGYFCNHVDRASISVMYGPLTTAYGLTASGFGLAVGFFYISYLLFEISSNIALAKFGARGWMSRILINWSAVMVARTAAHRATSFYVLRMLLGIAEAGFYPGVLYFLRKCYPPRALGRANSLFSVCIRISLAIGSMLTSSLLLLDGVWGLAGYHWVFIVEGLPPVLLGIYMLATLPDCPARPKWLTNVEAAYSEARLSPWDPAVDHSIGVTFSIFKSGMAWIFYLLYFCFVIGFWSVTYFPPRIVQERFHVGPVQAGFASAIPWVITVIAILVVARTSSKTDDRRRHMLILFSISAAGLFFTAATNSPVLARLGLAMGAAGMESACPLFSTMPATIFRGAMAAAAFTMINSLSNLSGFAGPWVLGFFTEMIGSSRAGLSIIGGFFVISTVTSFVPSSKISRRSVAPDVVEAPATL